MTNNENQRQVRWRAKILSRASTEQNNVASTCRYFGISRKTFYKWLKRYNELGETALANQSTRPHKHPNSTPPEVISKILYLRQNYHFGAGRIKDYLARYHQIKIAVSTVQSALLKHGINRLPANQKKYDRNKHHWKRYEKQRPGHRVQIDVKFLDRVPGTRKRFYQFTAIDDCTRIRILKIYDSCTQKSAIEFIEEVTKRLPFRIQVVQTDNGGEFQSKFHYRLEELGIEHVYIRPRTPRLNGKVERSHRIDAQEFYQLLDKNGVSDDIHLFNKKLRDWENFYNFNRPHGALDGQTPYERLKQKQRLGV